MQITLDIINKTRSTLLSKRFFILTAQKTLGAVSEWNSSQSGRARIEISLVFVSKNEMRRLNKAHRGKNKPTDVLSFPYKALTSHTGNRKWVLGRIFPMRDPDGVIRLGEIVIVPEIVRREASAFHHTIREQYRFLFIHGLLHLLGYDHERSRRDEKEMFALQENILEQLLAS